MRVGCDCKRAGDCRALLDEALGVVRHNGEALNEAELWRLKGELLLRVSDGHTERSEDNDPNEETTDLPL